MEKNGKKVGKSLFSPSYCKFLELLRDSRVHAGLTQVQAAQKLGRPQSYVSKCESGERRVDTAEFIEFCQIYGVDPCGIIRQLESAIQTKRRKSTG